MLLIYAVDCPALQLVRMMALMFVMIFFCVAQQPPADQGLLINEVPRSHSDTPQSVGLLWTRDQADAETSA